MFGSFQAKATSSHGPGDSEKGRDTGSSRRISTTNACLECRRRKIRCDGTQPCSQCQWYHQPNSCRYAAPTQRVVPSRALVEKLTARNAQNEAILQRLFPGRDAEALASLSRDELVNIALALPATSPSAGSAAHNHVSGHDSVITTGGSDTANSLEDLEQAPSQDPETDETQRHFDKNVQRVSDDVNGLSLNVDKRSSYVGASSITAALKVIFRVAPGARLFLAHSRSIETALPSRAGTPPPPDQTDAYALPSHEEGCLILDAFFTHVHPLMPAVNEQQVWQLWQQKTRQDAPWLALLNTVFVLGSMAAFSAENKQHTTFFARAMHHINIELLGSGDLMVVQALGLLAGYYFHYLSRPNLANNLMGACLRMELAMGMHREFSHAPVPPNSKESGAFANTAEQRRQTWWTIYNLDTWAGFTTGRPTMGRSGPGVTVRPPSTSSERMDSSRYQEALKMLPLIHNTTLSKIATRIQDSMAINHALEYEDVLAFDSEIVAWHSDLPSILLPPNQQRPTVDLKRRTTSSALRNPPLLSPIIVQNDQSPDAFDFSEPIDPNRNLDACPPFLKTSRIVMHYRWQNLRIVISRPAVLAAALRRMPFASLPAEEKVIVTKCRAIAAQTIHDISTMTEEEHIVGWTGTWFMYNAVMVPLVSLFSHLSLTAANTRHDQEHAETSHQQPTPRSPAVHDSEVREWKAQIEIAIRFLDRMIPWCSTAKKSHDVVRRLYEASEHFSEYNRAQHEQLYAPTPSAPHPPTTSPVTPQRQNQAQMVNPQQRQQHPQDQRRLARPSVVVPSDPNSASRAAVNPPQSGMVPSFPINDMRYPSRGQMQFTNHPGPNHPAHNPDHPSMGHNMTMQGQIFNDPNFWTMQAPPADVSFDINHFWQEMQWDTVPMVDGMEFSEYNTAALPGSVAAAAAAAADTMNGYFPDSMPHSGPSGYQ